MVVEKASGEPYATFLQKNIFDPLGMRDTGVDNGIDVVENLAPGSRTAAALDGWTTGT
jgi:CubicO group peptidase (beta-lactamase class C family)